MIKVEQSNRHENTCNVEGCNKRKRAKGYCQKHYQQVRKNGTISVRTRYDRNKIIAHDTHAEIELYDKHNNCIALAKIDKEFIDKVKKHKWNLNRERGYVVCRKINTNLHRFILDLQSDTEEIDHINQDKLDNRISNLRKSTPSENSSNKNNTKMGVSGMKGVNYHKPSNKWVAVITCNNISYYSKYFNDIKEANECREIMELFLHKDYSPRYQYLKEKYKNVDIKKKFEEVVSRKQNKK